MDFVLRKCSRSPSQMERFVFSDLHTFNDFSFLLLFSLFVNIETATFFSFSITNELSRELMKLDNLILIKKKNVHT